MLSIYQTFLTILGLSSAISFGQHGLYVDARIDFLKWEIESVYPPGSTGSHGDFTPSKSYNMPGWATGLAYRNKIVDFQCEPFYSYKPHASPIKTKKEPRYRSSFSFENY